MSIDYVRQFEEERNQQALDLYNQYKDDANLNAEQLWSLRDDYFIKWRQINDFPKLLEFFDKNLVLFKEWKSKYNITNEIIIKNGKISPFLERKMVSSFKKLYLCEFEGEDRSLKTYVGYGKPVNKNYHQTEPRPQRVLLEFHSYLDWLHKRKKKENILKVTSTSAPDHPLEQVFIHGRQNEQGYKLLKMGGLTMSLSSRYIEFANMSNTILEGGHFQGPDLSYCVCNNLKINNYEGSLVDFFHCRIRNIKVKDSDLRQFRFYNCDLTGEFRNTYLTVIRIWGGYFNPVLKDCNIDDVSINKDKAIPDNNFRAAQLLKKTYANQGDDENAIKYFLMEKEFVRRDSKGLSKWFKTFSFFYWGYGRRPQNIIAVSIGLIVLFAFIYWLYNDLIQLNNDQSTIITFWDCLYFSSTTFTALGYGDYSPHGIIRLASVFESFLGVLNAGFLVAGFASNKY